MSVADGVGEGKDVDVNVAHGRVRKGSARYWEEARHASSPHPHLCFSLISSSSRKTETAGSVYRRI